MPFMWEDWKIVVLRGMENGTLKKRGCPIMVDGKIMLLRDMDGIVIPGLWIGRIVGRDFSLVMLIVRPSLLMKVDSRMDFSMVMGH